MLIGLRTGAQQLVAALSDSRCKPCCAAEHGGMNEVLADVFAITGDKKYLDLARRFSHRVLEPLAEQQDKLTGLHANTQIPKVIGFERIAELDGDARRSTAAAVLLGDGHDHRTRRHRRQQRQRALPPTDDFSLDDRGPRGPRDLQHLQHAPADRAAVSPVDPTRAYADYYERALYNHILSSQHPEHGGLRLLHADAAEPLPRVLAADAGFWCCVGTGMESHAKYGEFIYAHEATRCS